MINEVSPLNDGSSTVLPVPDRLYAIINKDDYWHSITSYFLVETGTIDDSQSQRALILKDDYWAGNPNYMYIKKQ